MSRRAPPWCALVLALLASGANADEAERLLSGQPRERSITAEENHVYRVEVADAPLLVTVEQRSIDLVVETRRPGETEPLLNDAQIQTWGPEVVLLTDAGEASISVRSGQRLVPSGSYSIGVRELSTATEEDRRRVEALAAMSRGSRREPGGAGSTQAALDSYRHALGLWRSLGDKNWEAEALQAVAASELMRGELRPAAADYSEALKLWRDLSNPHREATALWGLGQTHQVMGEAEPARNALEGAIKLWSSLGQGFEKASVQRDLCLLEQKSGALAVALACLDEVRALFRDLGAASQEALILNSLGGIDDLLGEPDAALVHYQKALALNREAGNLPEQARTLNNIAVVHRTLGNWQEALRVYDQAREILPASGDRLQRAAWLNNVGYLYNLLGESQRAVIFLEEALELFHQGGDRRSEIVAMNNLGLARRSLGETDKALNLHRQARELAEALKDTRQMGMSRLRLAEVQLEREDPAAALQEVEQALAHWGERVTSRVELQALQLRGRALALAGKPQEALLVHQKVLDRSQALRDPFSEADALQAMAVAERALGLRDKAWAHTEAAMARVEDLRTGLVSLDLRASFLATRRRVYGLAIDLLMDRHAAAPQAGHDQAALEISERARARSLADGLRPRGTGHAQGQVPAELMEQWQSLRRRLSAKADQQMRQSIRAGDPKAETRGREIETLRAELDGAEAKIRRYDPEYAALSEPSLIRAQDIPALLDSGTLLLEYALGEERSFLWAVEATGSVRSFELPPRREIEALARRVYEEMRTVEAGVGRQETAAESLSRILLGPVWSESSRFERLVLVPDGALHYVPFAALPLAKAPLVETLEIVSIPSATTLALQRQQQARRPPAEKWAAVLADPVFTPEDQRLSEGSEASRRESPAKPLTRSGESLIPVFDRLPASRNEAEIIASLDPAGRVWTVLDLAASREMVLSGELRPYRFLHFATHGIADARNQDLSGLVLSLVDASGSPREGFLGVWDLSSLDLGADLVVLSGCRTALGKEVGGEGLMGLTRAFLNAGVPRVVAGLWQVQDTATAELMTRFYRGLWQKGLRPAAALREAQRDLKSVRRYKDPYAWAGFLLQGDWR